MKGLFSNHFFSDFVARSTMRAMLPVIPLALLLYSFPLALAVELYDRRTRQIDRATARLCEALAG
jgi:hypothetical protein